PPTLHTDSHRRRRCERDRRCCRTTRRRRSCRRSRDRPTAMPRVETMWANRPDGDGARQASLPEDSTEVSFENRRWLFELLAKAGEMLQLADRLFGLPHAFG